MGISYRVPISGIAFAFVVALSACSHDSATEPTVDRTCAGNTVTLAALQGVTLSAADLGCLSFVGAGGTYLVVPQFATTTTDTAPIRYELGAAASGTTARIALDLTPAPSIPRIGGPRDGLQAMFDGMLRARERTLLPMTASSWTGSRTLSAERAQAVTAPPPVGSTTTFQVCGNLNCDSTAFKTDTAVLKFAGSHILFYASTKTPPGGLTDAQITAFANLFDQTLYGIDAQMFGPPSDIDDNGRVIVLMSPYVNAITPANTCESTGFVAGFFFGADLVPNVPHSNRGEIYYSLAPDPNGTFSCAHTVAEVESLTGATFLHELLHMINFGEKVLTHGLNDTEAEFLDEGMAKVAEELGARYYEQKFPAPTGRTDPTQPFPDSAVDFIAGDLFDSYDFLRAPSTSTATITGENASTLHDAGGEWLFLRWLGDQKDSTVYTRIVESGLTGLPNLEAAAGESFPTLFGDFSLALYTDSLVGVSRDQIPPRYRFTSRNLRVLYRWLFDHVGNRQSVPSPFPITLKPLTLSGAVTGAMLSGTMDYYQLTVPTAGSAASLHFSQPGGTPFGSALNAQVSIFHCPSAEACQ